MRNSISADLRKSFGTDKKAYAWLDGKTILLTGVSGYFGKWLLLGAQHLNENLGVSLKVIGVSRHCSQLENDSFFNKPWVSFLDCSTDKLDKKDLKYDGVIHAATGGGIDPRSDDFMMDNIINGTKSVMKSAVLAGCKNVLYVSSGGVYGTCTRDYTHVPETSPVYYGVEDVGYKAIYGVAKLASEKIVASYAKELGLSATVARCFSFAGPFLKMDANFAIGNFISNVTAKQPIIIQSDGSAIRSYLYMSDLSCWLWTMLAQAKGVEVYNVGSETPYSISELAKAVSAALDEKQEVRVLGKPSGQAPDSYVPDVTKLKRQFSLKENFDLKEIILRTADWHRFELAGEKL